MNTEDAAIAPPHRPGTARIVLRVVLGLIGLCLIIALAWVAYIYAFSPGPIRQPQSAHYHFRLQIIINGAAVNFASSKFQESEANVCSVALTSEPIHFHDNLDQFVHIHWNHLTGGILLKNYGWNFIGGPGDTLGYNFTQPLHPIRIPTHGQALPALPHDAHLYVYTGDADSYQERNWNNFITQDFHDFFAGKPQANLSDYLIPTASAHGDDPKLTKLNDVLGNVVIFAQKTRPTDTQIKDRFNHLIPLPQSACGG